MKAYKTSKFDDQFDTFEFQKNKKRKKYYCSKLIASKLLKKQN